MKCDKHGWLVESEECEGCKIDALSRTSESTGYAESIIELMQIMEGNEGEPQWISAGETIFERLWFIVEQNDGRGKLEKLFPHYA